MLVVAAAIEAFWSSSRWIPHVVKYGVAAVCWTAVLGVLHVAGPPCRLTRSPLRLRPRAPARGGRPRRAPVPARGALGVSRAMPSSALPVARAGARVVRDRGLAADAAHLVGEAVARSHDPLRAVARRVRAATTRPATSGSAARRLVAAAAVHLDAAAAVAVAVVHAAGVPARRAALREAGARVPSIRRGARGVRR